MKKINLKTLSLALLFLVGVQSAWADGEETLQSLINAAGTTQTTITLSKSYNENITIAAGQDITLDLNGFNVANPDDITNKPVVTVSGILTLEDNSTNHNGAITGGNCPSSGGAYRGAGVHINTGGKMTMKSGNISNNLANDAGGVYIDANGAEFIMDGGTISNNTATNQGGAVFVKENGSSFTLNGGTISGNKAFMGSGVRVNGTFTMKGGSITDNQYSASAGLTSSELTGSTLAITGEAYLYGGSITNNTSETSNGVTPTASVITSKSTLATITANIYLKNDVTITGNKLNTEDDNSILLTGNSLVDIENDITSAFTIKKNDVGICVNTNGYTHSSLTVSVPVNYTTIEAKGYIYAKENCSSDAVKAKIIIDGTDVSTSTLTDATNLIYLSDNSIVTVTSDISNESITFPARDIILNLNGHTWDNSGITTARAITLSNGEEDNHISFTLNNGTIQNSTSPYGSYGGALFAASYNDVYLENVTFTCCSNTAGKESTFSRGGAIYIKEEGVVTAKNCTITNCEASYGPGVFVYNYVAGTQNINKKGGSFTMNGGKIYCDGYGISVGSDITDSQYAGKLTIIDGELSTSSSTEGALYVERYINVEILGGKFPKTIYFNNTANVAISGGKFATSPQTTAQAKLKSGYQWVSNASDIDKATYPYIVIASGEATSAAILEDGVEYTQAEAVNNCSVTYTRTVKNSFGTIVLPFVPTTYENVTFYTISSIDDGEGKLSLTKVTTPTANTPYIFYVNVPDKTVDSYDVTFSADNTTLYAAPTTAMSNAMGETGYTMYGTYAQNQKTVSEATNDLYYISNNTFWHATSTLTNSPYRAWLEAPKSTSAKAYTLVIGDEAAGIATVGDGNLQLNMGKIYDLQGRQINTPLRGKIYIVNGKKIIY